VVKAMVDLYLDRLPGTPAAAGATDPIQDIQMLVPWKNKAGLSAKVVNEEVQRRRAVKGAVELSGKFPIGVGDKVINTRNNYDLQIVNGDMGLVLDLWKDGSSWVYSVQFQGYDSPHEVPAIGSDLDLAYAVTVHKSQGSEWPVVILPAMGTRSPFYDRTLFYTGLSRAKSLGVIVGMQAGMQSVVDRMAAERRRTALEGHLTAGRLTGAARGFQGGTLTGDTMMKLLDDEVQA
jgi:exodeoxyribonuclease V alpha subunit